MHTTIRRLLTATTTTLLAMAIVGCARVTPPAEDDAVEGASTQQNNGAAATNEGQATVGDFCATDVDCQEGLRCLQPGADPIAICVMPCHSDNECVGSSCEPVYGSPVGFCEVSTVKGPGSSPDPMNDPEPEPDPEPAPDPEPQPNPEPDPEPEPEWDPDPPDQPADDPRAPGSTCISEFTEPNDAPSSAGRISLETHSAGVCLPGDFDFWFVDVWNIWRLDLRFFHHVGDLDVYVWDESSNQPLVIGSYAIGSDSTSDNESFEFLGPAIVVVFGYENAQAPYTITIEEL